MDAHIIECKEQQAIGAARILSELSERLCDEYILHGIRFDSRLFEVIRELMLVEHEKQAAASYLLKHHYETLPLDERVSTLINQMEEAVFA